MSFKIPYGYRMDPVSRWSYLDPFYWGRCLTLSFEMWREKLFYRKINKLLDQDNADGIHKAMLKENKRYE